MSNLSSHGPVPQYRSAADFAASDPEAYGEEMEAMEAFGEPSRPAAKDPPAPVTKPQELEPWQRALREGFLPQFRTGALVQLREALLANSEELTQHVTCRPAPEESGPNRRPCQVCVIGFLCRAEGAESVHDIEAAFHEACNRADRVLGYPDASKNFICWFDDGSRPWVLSLVLVEVELALTSRSFEVPETTESSSVEYERPTILHLPKVPHPAA